MAFQADRPGAKRNCVAVEHKTTVTFVFQWLKARVFLVFPSIGQLLLRLGHLSICLQFLFARGTGERSQRYAAKVHASIAFLLICDAKGCVASIT